jgi:hypothetical protein
MAVRRCQKRARILNFIPDQDFYDYAFDAAGLELD